MTKKLIRKFKEIFLDIYLIGYSVEGESIVICLQTDDKNSPFLFVGVIDCYCCEGVNFTVELLDVLGVKTLDFLCWSHPDKDHSLGIIDLLKNYSSDATRLVLPISLLDKFGNFKICYNSVGDFRENY